MDLRNVFRPGSGMRKDFDALLNSEGTADSRERKSARSSELALTFSMRE